VEFRVMSFSVSVRPEQQRIGGRHAVSDHGSHRLGVEVPHRSAAVGEAAVAVFVGTARAWTTPSRLMNS
jgi:hypothetical protein